MPSTLGSRMFASRLSIIPQVLRCSLRLGLRAGLAVEGTSSSNIRECKYLLTKVFTAVKLTEMDPLAEHCACTYWLGLSSLCGP